MKAGRLAALLTAVLALLFFVPEKAYVDGAPLVSAGSSIMIEASTQIVLCSSNAHQKRPMASTTKIMTALVALENCADIDETVTVPREAYGTEGSSMYLDLGEELSLRDLLYGLMLTSGNDAAIAIAVHIAGSIEAFAELMNRRAAELGALNTHFVTPNGLHDNSHYTTAYDLSLIAAAAMERGDFSEIVATQYYRTSTGTKVRTLKNKNKILWNYEGGNGVKTGYTQAAGKCYVFSAERNGMELIGVVLGSADIFADAEALLTYGFTHYEMRTLIARGQEVLTVELEFSNKKTLALAAACDIMVPVGIGRENDFSADVVLLDGFGTLPIRAGDKAGSIFVYNGDSVVDVCSMVAVSDAFRLDTFGFFAELARLSVR